MYEKLKHEIVAAYIKENNINMKKGKYNVSELTHDVNAIFFKCLNSYYFENHTKNEFVKCIDSNKNDYYYVVTLPNIKNKKNKIKHNIKDHELPIFEKYWEEHSSSAFNRISNNRALETKSMTMSVANAIKVLKEIPIDEYPIISDIFSNEYDMYNEEKLKKFPIDSPYDEKRKITEIDENQKIQRTIDILKQETVFNMLLTDDPIQQMLHLKNKNDINFKKVECNRDSFVEVSELLKLENHYSSMNTLMNHYSLNYFPQNKDKEYTAIVAHNDFEIAGITSIIDASIFHEYPKNTVSYVSYIEVSEQYYGRQLGIKLMLQAIEHAKEHDLILFRTPSSENGSTYIKDKINELARTSDVILVSEYEREPAFRVMEKYKTKSKAEIKEKMSEVLSFVRNNYDELHLNRSSVLSKIIKHIDDMDKKVVNKQKM